MRICFKGESPIASVTKVGDKNNHQQQLYCTHRTFLRIIGAVENYLYVFVISIEILL